MMTIDRLFLIDYNFFKLRASIILGENFIETCYLKEKENLKNFAICNLNVNRAWSMFN